MAGSAGRRLAAWAGSAGSDAPARGVPLPGASQTRPSPVARALGGQLIGSIATPRRRACGASVSPVNTIRCVKAPSTHSVLWRDPSEVGDPRPGQAVVVASQIGEAGVEPVGPDRACGGEVIPACRPPATIPVGIPRSSVAQPAGGRQFEQDRVDRRGAERQVGVSADSVRAWLGTRVDRLGGHRQAAGAQLGTRPAGRAWPASRAGDAGGARDTPGRAHAPRAPSSPSARGRGSRCRPRVRSARAASAVPRAPSGPRPPGWATGPAADRGRRCRSAPARTRRARPGRRPCRCADPRPPAPPRPAGRRG